MKNMQHDYILIRNRNKFWNLTNNYLFLYFATNPMEIKLIQIQIKVALYDVIHMADYRMKRHYDPKSSDYVMNKFTIHWLLAFFCQRMSKRTTTNVWNENASIFFLPLIKTMSSTEYYQNTIWKVRWVFFA